MSSGHSEGSRGSERSYYDDGGSSYEQDTQPCTQPQMLQPARARYLTDEDLIDSFCLIHPASYGAMLIVERTREYNPGIIVEGYDHMTAEGDSHDPRRKYKHDIALRMSTARNQFKEKGGWIFGRNPALCDVQLASFGNATTPQEKRISNKHFRIYVNGYGIVMLEDTSMNGTIVDGQLVHSRGKFGASKSRMLANGTTIQLQMDCQYPVTFIVWFPIRETKIEQLFVPRFKEWLYELIRDGVIANPSPIGAAGTRQPGAKEVAVRNDPTTIITVPTAFYQYESRWDGGKDYTVIDTIGSGAFATVYKVAAKSDGKVYACKEINKKHMMKNKHAGKILSHELKIMERLCHVS
ncbi:hypothetical protein KEM55_008223 [Ascosphaera atra]|nr:hypothetical protein KEM55_008223 [Ascosphaera atra]